jgi:hypothetical protein
MPHKLSSEAAGNAILKGKSYRLRERGLEVTPTSDAAGALFDPP